MEVYSFLKSQIYKAGFTYGLHGGGGGGMGAYVTAQGLLKA